MSVKSHAWRWASRQSVQVYCVNAMKVCLNAPRLILVAQENWALLQCW